MANLVSIKEGFDTGGGGNGGLVMLWAKISTEFVHRHGSLVQSCQSLRLGATFVSNFEIIIYITLQNPRSMKFAAGETDMLSQLKSPNICSQLFTSCFMRAFLLEGIREYEMKQGLKFKGRQTPSDTKCGKS